MRSPKMQQNVSTLHFGTAFHIKKLCDAIIFIVSWLIIHPSRKQDRDTLIEQSGKADIL